MAVKVVIFILYTAKNTATKDANFKTASPTLEGSNNTFIRLCILKDIGKIKQLQLETREGIRGRQDQIQNISQSL